MKISTTPSNIPKIIPKTLLKMSKNTGPGNIRKNGISTGSGKIVNLNKAKKLNAMIQHII